MGFGNVIIAVLSTYYTQYLISLISSKKREHIVSTNAGLDALRKHPVKTMEEQKKFVELKYPKTIGKTRFHLRTVPYILWRIVYFGALMTIYIRLLSRWEIGLYTAIPIVMLLPIAVNLVLEKYNLQRSDIRVFLR